MTLVLTYPCYYFRSFSATDFAFDPIFLILRFNEVKIFILWCLPRAFFTIIKYYCFSEFCVCPFKFYIFFFSSTDFVFDLIFSFSGVKVLISWGLSREFFTIKHYYADEDMNYEVNESQEKKTGKREQNYEKVF